MSTWTLKEKSEGELEVVIEGEVWKAACNKAFKKLCGKLNMPGFRKGHVPANIAAKQISKGERYMEAVDANANTWMREALAENKLEPLTQPQLDVKEVNDEKVVLSFTFTVEPEAVVGDYKSIEYKVAEVTVTDEEIENEITSMREKYAEVTEKEGAAADGDIVNIDFTGMKDGVEFEGGKGTNYDLTLGSNSFILGFEEKLIGAVAGEERALDLTFPEEYHSADLAGAAVVFNVKVNKVSEKTLPEVDDDFAADAQIKGVSTVAELRNAIRERIENGRKNQAENEAESAMLEALAAVTEVAIPDVMIEQEVQNQIQQMAAQLQQYGMSISSYLQMMGQTVDTLKEQYKEQAEKTVKIRLALAAVAKAENVIPTAEDIAAEFQEIADQYGMKVEDVKNYISEEMLAKDVANQKAMEILKGTH